MIHKHIQLSVSKESGIKEADTIQGEYFVAWKNIIFLPFDDNWQLFIMLSVVLDAMMMVYDIAYDHAFTYHTLADIVYYGFSMVYLFDTILSLAHRSMTRYRAIKEYVPKALIYVAFDIVSLLPIYESYLLVKAASRDEEHSREGKHWLRLKMLLRLYRVYDYFSHMNYNAGVNKVFVVCIEHYLKLIILTHLTAAIWYMVGCWKCQKRNWTANLKDFYFDDHNPLHWLIICYTTIGNTMAHNWRGMQRGEIPLEKSILILVMMFGYILHFMVYFGQLTNAYIKASRRQFSFMDNLAAIKRHLESLNIEKEWQDKTIGFYTVYWDKRCGIKYMPPMFNLLPIPLQKEVTVDIFWEALRHSHFYGKEDISFKRALSLEMKSEFFLPGDYVYRLNKPKSKMVYIVSGVLQILTAEDEESPIISFSSGTLLGEVSCLLPSNSIANVRCATYCELQTLNLNGLYRFLRIRPAKTRQLQAKLKNRIEKAREIHKYTQKHMLKRIGDLGYRAEDTSIRWIKRQWRQLSHIHRHQKKADAAVAFEIKADPLHTSEYLDFLVLTEKVELKMQVICLKGSCPFVLESKSSFRRFADYVVLVAIILQCLILPYHISFKRKISYTLFIICFLLDLIYFADIYLKLSTAIKDRNLLISQCTLIIARRLKDITFLIDVIATIPFDYVVFALSNSPHLAALLKLNRLLKMHAVVGYFNELEKSIWVSNLSAGLVKYSFLYILTGYWITCMMYSIACFYEQCSYYGWFNYNQVLKTSKYVTPYDKPFLVTLYYTLTTYLGFGISRMFMYNPFDLFAHHVLVMLGYYIFSFCFSELCSIFVLRLEKRRKYQDYIAGVIEFINMNKLTNTLKHKVRQMLSFWWYLNEDVEIIGENGILNDASTELKDKVVKDRIKECISKLPVFYQCEDKVIDALIKVCKLKTLPSNFELVKADKRYTWLHIILRGYCKMKSTMAGDFERDVETILRAGDAFPVMEVLHQVQSLINVTTITVVEVICIRYSDLIEILLANPTIGKEMALILEEHFKTYERSLLRKRGRLPEMIPKEHSLGRGDFFTYNIYDDYQIHPEQLAYLKPFNDLGKWSFLRYFLLRNTIDPHKTFFMCWEVFRCIFALIRVFIALTFFSLLLEYRSKLRAVIRLLDCMSFLDFYVRLHCQYYNELGILVTHPWATAKHYFKTTFAVDFFATMPFRDLQVDQMLGHRNRELVYSILALISRPWQLHRLVGFINYWQSNIEGTTKAFKAIKYLVLLTVVVGSVTVLVQTFTCTLQPPDKTGYIQIDCNNNSWITNLYIQGSLTPINIYVDCLYVAISILTTSTCGAFSAAIATEASLFCLLCILTSMFRWIIFTKLTSEKIGGNANLTIYQERVKNFLNFVKTEYIDEDLISETIEYYQYIWKATQGSSMTTTLHKLHADLHEDIVYHLYGSTIEAVDIFQGTDSSFCRQLGILLEVQRFKKDSEIIRCNDVQGLLFIVYKGKVDIMVAKERLCTLSRGGMFGCLEKQGITRQTVTAVAKVHVQLLVINSNLFHNVVGKYANVAEQLRLQNVMHSEYVKARKCFIEDSDISNRRMSSTGSIVRTWCELLEKKLNILIKRDDTWYSWWEYIVCVHVSTISSIWMMYYALMMDSTTIRPLAKAVIYTLDLVFIAKMYFLFHLSYIDNESGILITDIHTIRMRYLKSFKFFIDLLICIPFNVIVPFITPNQRIIQFSLGNNMFRFIYLVQYYNNCQNQLRVKSHLRWTYLFYWILISVQLVTGIWWLTACSDHHCYYLKSHANEDENNYVNASQGLESLMLAYTYTINLFTTTGIRDVAPLSPIQTLVSVMILCIFQYNIEALASEFATLLEIGQFSMSNYEYNINQLRTYLEVSQLSVPIINKVWKYSLQLWQRQRGEWMPAIITEAPGYLKQDLMTALYGHHFHNHVLFMNTHVDFLRQLIVHMKRCVFFPGNYITEKGDMDGSMYFINDGNVEVYDRNGDNEILTAVLKRGQSFGLEQGLYNTPHILSFKAKTVVDALILTRSDWAYLLEWFPASSQEIDTKAMEYGLLRR